jgi:hypothetical protein
MHPVQVESVAWLSERKTLLAMFFTLLSLHAYQTYSTGSGTGRRKWYLCTLICLVAALLSKAVAVIVPVIFICLDWYNGGGKKVIQSLPDKIPLLLLSGAAAAVTIVSQRSATSIIDYLGGSPANNSMTMMPVLVRYLAMIFWPTHLAPIYKPPIKTVIDSEVLLSGLLVLLLLSLGLYLFAKRHTAGLACAIVILGLLPVMQLVPLPTLMQDRYLYFPLLGFSLCVVILAHGALEKIAGQRTATWAGIALLALSTVPLAFAAHKQTAIWHDALTLWTYTVKQVPASKQAWIMLATTRHDLKDFAGAEQAYLKLIAMHPKELKALNGIGVLYGERGECGKALTYLRRAAEAAPEDSGTLVNVGYAAYLCGNLEESEAVFTRALAINPTLADTLLPTMAEIKRRQGNPAKNSPEGL